MGGSFLRSDNFRTRSANHDSFFLKQFGSTLPAILTRLLTKDKKDCFFNIHSVFNFIFIKKNGDQSAFITVYLLVVM